MNELNQLLLDFDIKRTFNDHDYYVSDSNYFAFSLIDKWPKWEKRILNISGEKYSGKTHLANIFKLKSSALFLTEKEINNDVFKKIKIYESIIIDIKDNLEDKWKSVNKINTSIVLPIRLSVDAKNIKLSEKLENILSSIDLVSNVKIEMFNNNKIIYKIIFNGSPDKLLDIMNLYNFKLDSSKKVWKVQ